MSGEGGRVVRRCCAVGADLMGLACATWKNVETEGARIRASGQGLYSLG